MVPPPIFSFTHPHLQTHMAATQYSLHPLGSLDHDLLLPVRDPVVGRLRTSGSHLTRRTHEPTRSDQICGQMMRTPETLFGVTPSPVLATNCCCTHHGGGTRETASAGVHMWVAGSEHLHTRPTARCESPLLRALGTNSRLTVVSPGDCLSTEAAACRGPPKTTWSTTGRATNGWPKLWTMCPRHQSNTLGKLSVGGLAFPRVALGSCVHT